MGARAVFVKEMRRLRTELGMTRSQLAARTAYKEPSIRAFECGNRTPTIALATGLDQIFDTKGLFAAVQREAEQETTPFGELKESEQRATAIRIWEPFAIPGLLQTAEYASILLARPQHVEERMMRQGIFGRENPPHVHVIISESVLPIRYGGPSVLRNQLEHLLWPDNPWTLQVVSNSAPSPIGADGQLMLLEFEGGEPAIAYLDSRGGGTVADNAAAVADYWRQWERLAADALSPEASREMIRAVFQSLPEV